MKKKRLIDVPTPWERLIAMLYVERTTINYIFIYAILIGLIGLTLPLGTTAVFNFLSNGALYSSTYILIGIVLLGVVLGGFLLIAQLTLVEVVEQKIFAKATLEFAYRFPRIKRQEFDGEHPPELVNRFFDVITIQKGLTKLLVDVVASTVQIFFAAILLSFYHPVFIIFGVFTVLIILLMLGLFYKRGVDTSIDESEYKYEVVAYLEKVADNLDDYRNQPEQLKKVISETDKITAKYLRARNDHFKILRKFFASSVVLRTILMGGLLLLGSYYVVQRQMTLGQFVAAEVIIVQISYAVEKFMTSLNTIFDMVTGSEKLAVVTDLELEESGVTNG
ncbi:ABC transporter transmembrane domain-containing protein [Dyadobacter psychrotolerans]|uniref:ABC transporter ATP-binding protein n=1 Tax=Dyadobacter psychrotolerans TaxID=2541721 RepID=A0A4R5DM78_9BACT|nr:ABC transporter transmembrane domain-containing protein [Dyadobacter psychrotolerans]TDE15229.1 ABC transporter ATP-binding protein [Dyadobacter psychrotolerans]